MGYMVEIFALIGGIAVTFLSILGLWVIANGINEYETAKVRRNRRFGA